MSARVSALVVSFSLAIGFVGLLGTACAADKKEQPKVSEKVGKPLTAALDAAKNKQFDVALAKTKEAEAEKKTPFEQFKINETLAFIYGSQKKYTELATTYEKMLEAPQFLTPEQLQSYPKSIAQLYASTQQNAKAIEYAKKLLQEKPNDTEMLAMLGQIYYNTKDNKGCLQTFSNAIAVAEKAGGKPAEAWLQFARTCANSVGDDNAETQAYEKLVRFYPKPDYWQAYLRRTSKEDRSSIASFNWLRLMGDTGALKQADDYMTYAQQAIAEFGVPCEAVRVLEDGFNKKVLGVDEKVKARHTNTLVKAKEAAQSDKARLSQLTSEAESDATGQKNVDAGMIYFGCGQYDQAIAQLDKGIKKGGAKEIANAKLALGIAQLRKGERDVARATFKSVASDQVLGKVAAAWTVRSYN